MNKATQLLTISILISIVIIVFTADEWTNAHKKQIINGDVIDIIDGGALKVMIAGKTEIIRLAYLECPQNDNSEDDAKTALRNIAENKTVRLNIIDVDEKGKLVAEVFVIDQNINLYLIRTGMCYVDYRQAKGKDKYFDAEDLARSEALGVHQD